MINCLNITLYVLYFILKYKYKNTINQCYDLNFTNSFKFINLNFEKSIPQ